MFATIASLFSGHVVGDATPPPAYAAAPGALLTVPSNFFGGHQSAPTQGVPQSALTASAAASHVSPAQSASSPKASPPIATTPVATTSVAKPAVPQGILCHGTYYDACPADSAFQCLDTGRLCRPISVPAQVIGTTPKKSDCQVQEDQILAQIAALQQSATQNTDGGGETDTAAKITDLQSQYHALQSTCSS